MTVYCVLVCWFLLSCIKGVTLQVCSVVSVGVDVCCSCVSKHGPGWTMCCCQTFASLYPTFMLSLPCTVFACETLHCLMCILVVWLLALWRGCCMSSTGGHEQSYKTRWLVRRVELLGRIGPWLVLLMHCGSAVATCSVAARSAALHHWMVHAQACSRCWVVVWSAHFRSDTSVGCAYRTPCSTWYGTVHNNNDNNNQSL
jgi:hypothetical protein